MAEDDEKSVVDKISEVRGDQEPEVDNDEAEGEGEEDGDQGFKDKFLSFFSSDSGEDEDEEGEDKSFKEKALGFFSTVGEGVERTGKFTVSAQHRIRKTSVENPFGGEEEEKVELSDRLQELKRMEEGTGEESQDEWYEEEEEEGDWGDQRDEELERPASERVADIFVGMFGGLASSFSGFFSELDEDLYRANMTISPQRYIATVIGVGVVAAIFSVFFVWMFMGLSIFMALAPPLVFFVVLVVGRGRPSSRIQSRATEINQEIPYALRHMATQLSSGIGLPETMTSVANANYEALSEEFDRTLQEMRAGESMVGALASMRERVESDAMERAIRQVERTLRTGGNLSKTLSILADETAMDLRMNLKDYTQSLNMMGMMYMFGSGVIPPMLIVVLIVGGFMGNMSMSSGIFALLFLIAVPFLLFYMVFMFKRMEPEV